MLRKFYKYLLVNYKKVIHLLMLVEYTYYRNKHVNIQTCEAQLNIIKFFLRKALACCMYRNNVTLFTSRHIKREKNENQDSAL